MLPRMIFGLLASSIMVLMPISAEAAWRYRTETDPMTGAKTYYANSASSSTYNLGFPYGHVGAALIVREHPRHGTDVIFSATTGQIPCHQSSGCLVLLRFDKNPPIDIIGSGPEDGSSTDVFLSNPERLIQWIVATKTLKVEVTFFQAGSRIFHFDIAGFNGKKFNPTQPPPPPPAPPTEHSALPIARKHGCFECHKINEPHLAPSFTEIAKRYRDAPPERMAKNIRQGGSTQWGAAPKPPTPNLDVGESIELEIWILGLK